MSAINPFFDTRSPTPRPYPQCVVKVPRVRSEGKRNKRVEIGFA